MAVQVEGVAGEEHKEKEDAGQAKGDAYPMRNYLVV